LRSGDAAIKNTGLNAASTLRVKQKDYEVQIRIFRKSNPTY